MKRLLHKLLAIILHTFTAECPVCHGHFHGRNRYKTNVKVGKKHYRIICHRCAKSIQKSNK